MEVLCVEEKGTVDQKYHLSFAGVVVFDFWKDNRVLIDNSLEIDTRWLIPESIRIYIGIQKHYPQAETVIEITPCTYAV